MIFMAFIDKLKAETLLNDYNVENPYTQQPSLLIYNPACTLTVLAILCTDFQPIM